MTARQQLVVESMSFLKWHCTSIPVRKGVDLTAARKKRYGDAPSQNIPASDPAAPEDAPSTPSTASVHSDSDLLEEREALTQELRQLRQERTDAAAVTTRQLTHLMRQMTPSLRDQFMTETLASAVRYVDLSREQTKQLPPQQLPSVPAQQHQPILQDFRTPQRPMHQAQQQPPQYAQDHAQQLNPPTTETERRHFFTTLQGCYPDFTGSSCPPPAPTYATLTVRRTPTATVTTDGIIAGAAAAAGIPSFSTTIVQSPTVSTPQMASTPTTQPADASQNMSSFMRDMIQDGDETTSY
ncbi:uncharacterized protein LOC128546702 [Mercenaria mercenaria]|uniref:uncharacterized protein LOC128546702 n=1 Tax=Mercenaria mercenaria TaxID=6596 RepID=UPI00234F67E9|nr:uncharacterized protein LOC128546702 [Mercenaria mercenaria]